jgi:hypothetical protein
LLLHTISHAIFRFNDKSIHRPTRLPRIQLSEGESYIGRGQIRAARALKPLHAVEDHANGELTTTGFGLAPDLPCGSIDSASV